MEFSATPAATGRQLVRTTLPFPDGLLPRGQHLAVSDGRQTIAVAVRAVGRHGSSADASTVRSALITFPYDFETLRSVRFSVVRAAKPPQRPTNSLTTVARHGDAWTLQMPTGARFRVELIWPESETDDPWRQETVEDSAYFEWVRWKQTSEQWTRLVEFRTDALGQVVGVAHLQRAHNGDNWAPSLGWEITNEAPPSDLQRRTAYVTEISQRWALRHSFVTGHSSRYPLLRGDYQITHPASPYKRCGAIFVRDLPSGAASYRYLRSRPIDRVPMQPFSWRRAEFVMGPQTAAPLTPLLTSPHHIEVDWAQWDAAYGTGRPVAVGAAGIFADAVDAHRQAILDSVMVGHDWGNLSPHVAGQPHGALFGMNRLNHGPAMIALGLRRNDRTLVDAAIGWCDNFRDLSIWWGPKKTGGTRYPSLRLGDNAVPDDDASFTWRGKRSSHFCTKGYETFLLAYEFTGDPRFQEALEAQVQYAREHVHCDQGECRNIGDVADFVRLYELTGDDAHLEHARRLYRELRNVLSDGLLFSQSGKPLHPDPAYIDEDERGKRFPFPKPYIIGYALSGCPRLAAHLPDEPQLQAMVRAVADYMASCQDPAGGWRYPHPRSSRMILSQAMEHAWQLVQAARLLGPKQEYLDAMERVLQQRLWVWRQTGKFAGNLVGWETAQGLLVHPLDIYQRYEKPADRDPTRDYRDGRLTLTSTSTEGLVYFPEVLRYYLEHRDAARLLTKPEAGSPLAQILTNIHPDQLRDDLEPAVGEMDPSSDVQQVAVRSDLPVFAERTLEQMAFPLAWRHARRQSFAQWRRRARRRVFAALEREPTPTEFNADVVSSQQRDGYVVEKVALNLNAENRVLGYLLTPEGDGPHPGVLLLHDHGAEFRIGKEKLVEPWDVAPEKQRLSREWVDKYYGGRHLGDVLARRGYICFVTDALNWSDRGGGGFDGQQALASNMLHLGRSLAGWIAHEDLRAAEFLAAQPGIDRERVAAMGLSMGGFRTWQVAALSDQIAAGASICWMATVEGLMQPGNNQTHGHSSFTMLHPGLLGEMDYPDIASLACPKPMLFYAGRRDHLFPTDSVDRAYRKMRAVWQTQSADDRLETRMWDVPHEFSKEMQNAAFAWLDQQFGRR